MNTVQIVEYMILPPSQRREIWAVALNRGLDGEMKIEKWLLIEMLARLFELEKRGEVAALQGEHSYQRLKSTTNSRFESCDFWWKQNDSEYWLEVKTIRVSKSRESFSVLEIRKDLEKRNQLNPGFKFYHLAVLFPLSLEKIQRARNTLDSVYAEAVLEYINHWSHPLADGKFLVTFLYGK